jgi:hypothetical protein
MIDDGIPEQLGPTAARVRWLWDLERALGEAEGLTRRLSDMSRDCPEAAVLLAQIQLARETLEDLRFADVAADHPDWVELFRNLAELADRGQTPWGMSPPPPNSTM